MKLELPIIWFESYLHKLVGLLSVEAVGETQHIRGSWFVQFTHELVEAGMDLVLSLYCWSTFLFVSTMSHLIPKAISTTVESTMQS